MSEQRYVDVLPKRGKPTLLAGVRDALLRASRSAGGRAKLDLPRNRGEARRLLRGNGPHMRFRYEVDDEGVRRGVRVRV